MYSNEECMKEIRELLDNYEDGLNIFKKDPPGDWMAPLARKEGSTADNIPETWMGLAEAVIGIIAKKKYDLDTYPNVMKLISAEYMIDAYTNVGMPKNYTHWSFGLDHARNEAQYRKGQMGLAYEIVINTNPCEVYNMDTNSRLMMLLVTAHAGFGHNTFFKNNHLFTEHTDAEEINPLLERLKRFVKECEEKYGIQEVEDVLSACHALESHAVNRYSRPRAKSPKEIREQIEERRKFLEQNYDHLLEVTTRKAASASDDFKEASEVDIRIERDENLLRFIADYSPKYHNANEVASRRGKPGEPWQTQLMRMIADKSQYFYPQIQTKVMNEGCASFWHYRLLGDMYDMDLIDDGMYMEFITSHSGVLTQRDFDSKYYSGFNPYKLGFEIFMDIERVCNNPTDEDKEWFGKAQWFQDVQAGKADWLSVMKDIVVEYRDETFVSQFLSPKVIREMSLFVVHDDEMDDEMVVTAIHNRAGYEKVRDALADHYNLANRTPQIEVVDYDYSRNRALYLEHTVHRGRELDDDINNVLQQVWYLWSADKKGSISPVILNSVDSETGEQIQSYALPKREEGKQPGRKRQP
ncbi:MAG: SpoVR family protein [Alphaproteobacteria bacterium]|nr:SpoVR family protein [Alphaproteobacteria bacterium]